MRVLVQRVTAGSVTVGEERVGEVKKMAQKVVHLRIFEDDEGKFNRSLLDVGGAALVVSQFTLYADARKGRRPSFIQAARPEQAAPLVEAFASELQALGVPHVAMGRFGASMLVEIHNSGPVTIWLDSNEL